MKSIFLFIILFSITNINADILKFNLANYNISANGIKFASDTSGTSFIKHQNITIPNSTIIINTKIDSLKITSTKKTFIKHISYFENKKIDADEIFSDYKNIPLSIITNGKMRSQDISILQKVPFIFRNDSLFFVDEISYLINGKHSLLAKKVNPIININKKVNMIIITSLEFLDIFTEYSNFKSKLGINSAVYTTEYIYSNYEGVDPAGRIRNFIKEQYKFNKISFVLLGGAFNIIPIRNLLPIANLKLVPSDLYYSCLDGSFDTNNNGIYGEIGDSIDYFPEVLVGRFTGSNKSELSNIINKTIKYFSKPLLNRTNFFTESFLLALNLFNEKDTEHNVEHIKSTLSTYFDFKFDSLYETSSISNSKLDVIQYFNKSYNIVYGVSHGSETCIGTTDNWLFYNNEIYSSTSTSGLYYLASCHLGEIAIPTFAHRSITSPTGGCVNYIGASTEDYPNVSKKMNGLFFSNFVSGKDLGTSLINSKIQGCPDIKRSSTDRHHYFAYNIFGDPSSKLFINKPEFIKIDSISKIQIGNSTIRIRLSEKPLKPITFSLIQKNELISAVETDSQEFSIPFSSITNDSILLSYISVLSPLQDTTLIVLGNSTISTLDIMLLDNNKNKIIENGEIFHIGFNMKTSLTSSNSDTIQITLQNSFKDILIPIETLNIPLSSNNYIADTLFNLQYLSDTFSNDTTIELTIYFTIDTITWQETLSFIIASPKLDLQYIQYDSISKKISPTLKNNSLGIINNVRIKIIDAINFNTLDSFNYTNILGEEILKISEGFAIDSSYNFYLDISINNSSYYSSDTFFITSTPLNNIDIKISSYSSNIKLEWTGDFSDNDFFNIFIQYNDSISKLHTVNAYPINGRVFEFSDTFSCEKFIRIAIIDSNKNQSNISKAIKTRMIPIINNNPFVANIFPVYMSYFLDNNIALSSRNSSISSLNLQGLPTINKEPIIFTTKETLQENPYTLGSAVGDINGDGNPDMVNFSNAINDSVTINVIDLTNGNLIASKKVYGYPFDNAPAIIYDLSTSPKTGKILLSLFNGNINGDKKGTYIYLYSLLDGELNLNSGYPIISRRSDFHTHTPIIADLDFDGYNELIFDSHKYIQVYDPITCTLITEFALESPIASAINVSDLDKNESLEIIALTDNTKETKSTLHVLSYLNKTLSFFNSWDNGKTLESHLYSFYANFPSPSCVDINADSLPEIIAITGKNIYVYSLNGNPFPGFPVALSSKITSNNISAPSFADFNGDGFLDILFLDNLSTVSCISGKNAEQLSGFPISIPFSFDRIFGSIPIADLDNDGDLEFGIGNKSGSIIVFDYFGNYSNRWISDNYRADTENSGIILSWDEILVNVEETDNLIINKYSLLDPYPNPFNPETKISFSVPKTKIKNKVSIKIFDLKGCMIKEIANGFYKPGIHSINFNAKDKLKNNIATGIYFCKMKAGNFNKTLKLLYIK